MRHTAFGRGICKLIVAITGLFFLTSCSGSDDGKRQITWFEGTPPPGFASVADGADRKTLDNSLPTAAITETSVPVLATESPTSLPSPTTTLVVETPVVGEAVGVATRILTPDERLVSRPNELGMIPVLMYHSIVNEDIQSSDGYTRSTAQFRADLQLLFDLGYYVVPLSQVVENAIAAPPGKQPVVLTFDDGTAGHFRYLIGEDGSVSIDPESVVGILESFFATHPDFGRGGFFAVPPKTCFDWEADAAEPEQTRYCGQKLAWLVSNGYEIGNHTYDHTDLLDLEDDQFVEKVGQGWTGLTEAYREAKPNILALPFGNYPDREKHPAQRAMMRDGFEYDGQRITIAAALMVGANPASSPASSEWDPLFIARIRAYDGELGSAEWLDVLQDAPNLVYRSDGDPTTITVPEITDKTLGTLDVERLEADGRMIIVYDDDTGDAV